MKSKINIIEDKSVDGRMIKKKTDAWKYIEEEFLINGKTRDISQIKEQWRRMKREARQRISKLKTTQTETGGGSDDEEPPNPVDFLIRDLIPHDFVEDQNIYDSQGQDTKITILGSASVKKPDADFYILNPSTGYTYLLMFAFSDLVSSLCLAVN